MNSTNPIVANAIATSSRSKRKMAMNGVLDYSQFQPESKWEVLDDLEVARDLRDLNKIKPYAQRFGVMKDWEETRRRLGL